MNFFPMRLAQSVKINFQNQIFLPRGSTITIVAVLALAAISLFGCRFLTFQHLPFFKKNLTNKKAVFITSSQGGDLQKDAVLKCRERKIAPTLFEDKSLSQALSSGPILNNIKVTKKSKRKTHAKIPIEVYVDQILKNLENPYETSCDKDTIKHWLNIASQLDPGSPDRTKILLTAMQRIESKKLSPIDFGYKTANEILKYCSLMGDLLTDLQLPDIRGFGENEIDTLCTACPNLKKLNYKGNITDEELRLISRLSSLKSLTIKPQFHSISSSMNDPGELQHISIWQFLLGYGESKWHRKLMLITDAGLEHLSRITSLQSLNLGNCSCITNEGFQHLGKLTFLKSLKLKNCQFITDAAINHLSDLTSLQLLKLEAKKVMGYGLAFLKNLKYLIYLNLKGCSITTQGLGQLCKISSLEGLRFSRDLISNEDLAQHLSKLPVLKETILFEGDSFREFRGIHWPKVAKNLLKAKTQQL